jgi:5'(3')-deoxyribonucleotidase
MANPFLSLCDVDGVLGDFPIEALSFCNRYGRTSDMRPWVLEDITEHDILKSLQLDHLQDRFDVHMEDSDFCRHMPLYDGAQDFVESLKSLGDLVIVTASYGAVRGWESARRAWLLEHFGIRKRDVVFATRKELVAGNFFLDDKLKNIDPWVHAWGRQGIGVVFDRPWNQGIQFRVNSFDAALKVATGLKAALEKRP